MAICATGSYGVTEFLLFQLNAVAQSVGRALDWGLNDC